MGRNWSVVLMIVLASCGFEGNPAAGLVDAAPVDDAQSCSSSNTCTAHSSCLDDVCVCDPGFAMAAGACVDVNECLSDACAGSTCENSPGTFACFATTCAGVRAFSPNAADGDYPLYIGGDRNKMWIANCVDMTTSPTTFLIVNPQNNQGMYKAGGGSPGTDVITNYARLAVSPGPGDKLFINAGNQRFAANNGASLKHSNDASKVVTTMPIAVAMSCSGTKGTAMIDLTGTSFQVTQMFGIGGNQGSGSIVVNPTSTSIALSGNGSCGWAAPTSAPFDPYNSHDFQIEITYAP
jgi:hypothetical protein